MWHEARKQEKKLRCMIVDYRKRAERRREFYEKFKADPTQFMQVHGRPSKIYLEPQIAASAENCMMPWQGNADNMIDRFDVRAHLDIIPEWHGGGSSSSGSKSQAVEEEQQNPGINYERYRILIQNDLSGTSEDKFLHQIHLEEQFGNSATPHSHMFGGRNLQPKAPKAAIGYNYEDSTPAFSTSVVKTPQQAGGGGGGGSGGGSAAEADEESEEEIDFDLLVNVDDLTHGQKAELNNFGTKYGLGVGDFMEYLNGDLEEKEKLRLAKLQEEEKQAMSGRKARRERRAYKDKLIMRKGYISPPSYATYVSTSPTAQDNETENAIASRRSSSRSESRSRSNSPEKITFITSFGGNESDDGSGNRQRNNPDGKPLPFEPSSRHHNISSGAVFGPSLPPGSDKKGGDSNKRGRFISRRSRSLDLSSSNRRRNNRSRSRSHSRRRTSRSRRSSSRGRRRGSSSGGGRRPRRSSSSSKSRSSRSRSKRNRRRRSSTRSSRSRDRDNRRKRRRSSRSTRSSRSRSRSQPRRSRPSRSRSRSRYRSRRSRSRNRRHSTRSSRSNSRNRNTRRRRKSTRSSSSSSSSSSSQTSSPPKSSSSSRKRNRKLSKSSSSSPVHHVSRRNSKSKERPSIPVISSAIKDSENGFGATMVSCPINTATAVETISLSAQQPSTNMPLLKEPTPPPPPPVRRYYGRGRKENSQSSTDSESLSGSDWDNEKDGKSSAASVVRHNGSAGKRDSEVSKGKSGLVLMMSSASKEEILTVGGVTSSAGLSASSSSCVASVAKLTPKERLRRKMQSALTKTFKADKEAEKQRQEKQVQERMEREESLRELTIKYRRREREKRHRDREVGGRSSSSDSSHGSGLSGSRSRSPSPQSPLQRRQTSRSRSRSPVSQY